MKDEKISTYYNLLYIGYRHSRVLGSAYFLYYKYIMEKFLNQFSTLPKKFVSDFYIIAKEEYTGNELIINFELICDWLETRKDHLKKVLVKNFEEKYDYIINVHKVTHTNGNGTTIRHDIFVTPNCFKELCMLSQTAKAKEVRKYFIEMEKLIKTYYDTIKSEMYKQIEILETNQKPKLNIKGGIIYVLEAQNSTTTLYKLGKTTDLKNRMKTYNTGNANDVEPLFILKVPDVDSIETCIKAACKTYRYRKYKEVYEIDIDVLKEVITRCNDTITFAIKNNVKNPKKVMKNNINKMKEKKNKYFLLIDKK